MHNSLYEAFGRGFCREEIAREDDEIAGMNGLIKVGEKITTEIDKLKRTYSRKDGFNRRYS